MRLNVLTISIFVVTCALYEDNNLFKFINIFNRTRELNVKWFKVKNTEFEVWRNKKKKSLKKYRRQVIWKKVFMAMNNVYNTDVQYLLCE